MIKKIIIVSAAIMAAVFLMHTVPVSAGESGISTNGNIVFENGTAGIYADDFNYLQDEIEALFNEIN